MIFLSPVLLSPSFDDFKIVSIDRVSVFAGKMGSEVRETWHVTKGGEEFSVIVMPYHTWVAGTPMFTEGETVSIHSQARGKTIRVTLREVSK